MLKKTKYKKSHKIKTKQVKFKPLQFNKLAKEKFNSLNLVKPKRIKNKSIENLQKRIKHIEKKKFFFFPNRQIIFPVTTKTVGSRIGKGKGNVSFFEFRIKQNYKVCDGYFNSKIEAKTSNVLGVKTKFIVKKSVAK